MRATWSRRTSSARAAAVVALAWGTSPFSTPATTTTGHSRPLAAWKVSSSTASPPRTSSSPAPPPIASQARNDATLAAGSAVQNW